MEFHDRKSSGFDVVHSLVTERFGLFVCQKSQNTEIVEGINGFDDDSTSLRLQYPRDTRNVAFGIVGLWRYDR